MRKYVIRCGSRTGSTYLCDLLRSTNRCGSPREYFNKTLEPMYRKELGVTDDTHIYEYRKSIVQKTKTENDVAGIKVVGVNEQWNALSRSGFDPKFWIRLYRKDILMQSISRYKAWKTDEWVTRNSEGEAVQLELVQYDRSGLQWCLDEIRQEEEVLHKFFLDKEPLVIEYEEDLLDNPLQTVSSILEYMDINTDDLPDLGSSCKIRRTDRDEEWKQRFLKEYE